MPGKISVENLRAAIQQADKAYYDNEGEVILTDEEYDAIKDELARVEPNDPLLKKVGETPTSASIWPKKKHRIEMGSLNKAKGIEGLREWWFKIEQAAR
jgi:DNA ligase (NAD+)